MKIFIKFVFLTFLILAGCAGTVVAQRSDQDIARLMSVNDNLIVPGERVGPVFLGMTEEQLYKRMGNPNESYPFTLDGYPATTYKWGGLTAIVINATQKVGMVVATDSQYSTAENVSVGISILGMKSKLGQPAWGVQAYTGDVDQYKYWYPSGLKVFTANGKVIYIRVERKD